MPLLDAGGRDLNCRALPQPEQPALWAAPTGAEPARTTEARLTRGAHTTQAARARPQTHFRRTGA
jgi:hypothetical protein